MGRCQQKKSKQTFKTVIFPLLTKLLGSQGHQNICMEPLNLIFKGCRCDHVGLEQLGAKNCQNLGRFIDFSLFFGGFWTLAALKAHTRICDPK